MNSTINVAAALLWFKGKVWIQQRQGTDHLDGYWEFPGGKVGPNETPVEAVCREVREETGIELSGPTPELLSVERFSYPEREVQIHFFLCRLSRDSPLTKGRWVSVANLDDYVFPPANSGVLEKIKFLR